MEPKVAIAFSKKKKTVALLIKNDLRKNHCNDFGNANNCKKFPSLIILSCKYLVNKIGNQHRSVELNTLS